MTHTWSAQLIAPDQDFAGAPLLRKEFTLDTGHGAVTEATLHVTAHGIVEPLLNGTAVKGATAQSFVLPSTAAGKQVACKLTAKGPGGTATAKAPAELVAS